LRFFVGGGEGERSAVWGAGGAGERDKVGDRDRLDVVEAMLRDVLVIMMITRRRV
jgi:hypothetical protein